MNLSPTTIAPAPTSVVELGDTPAHPQSGPGKNYGDRRSKPWTQHPHLTDRDLAAYAAAKHVLAMDVLEGRITTAAFDIARDQLTAHTIFKGESK